MKTASAVPWLRKLVGNLLTQMPGFSSWVSPCGICHGQSCNGTVFVCVLWFFPASIIAPLLGIHLFFCHQCYIVLVVDIVISWHTKELKTMGRFSVAPTGIVDCS